MFFSTDILIYIFSEIVAHVDEIEKIKNFNEGENTKTRWRFFVHNNDGKRIQVTLWNNEIVKFQPCIKLGNVSYFYFNCKKDYKIAFTIIIVFYFDFTIILFTTVVTRFRH